MACDAVAVKNEQSGTTPRLASASFQSTSGSEGRTERSSGSVFQDSQLVLLAPRNPRSIAHIRVRPEASCLGKRYDPQKGGGRQVRQADVL